MGHPQHAGQHRASALRAVTPAVDAKIQPQQDHLHAVSHTRSNSITVTLKLTTTVTIFACFARSLKLARWWMHQELVIGFNFALSRDRNKVDDTAVVDGLQRRQLAGPWLLAAASFAAAIHSMASTATAAFLPWKARPLAQTIGDSHCKPGWCSTPLQTLLSFDFVRRVRRCVLTICCNCNSNELARGHWARAETACLRGPRCGTASATEGFSFHLPEGFAVASAMVTHLPLPGDMHTGCEAMQTLLISLPPEAVKQLPPAGTRVLPETAPAAAGGRGVACMCWGREVGWQQWWQQRHREQGKEEAQHN